MLHLTEAIGIVDDIEGKLSNTRLRWWVAARTQEEGHYLGTAADLSVSGKKTSWRPAKGWRDNKEKDMESRRLKEKDVEDRISGDDSYKSDQRREE